jgi:hypothetical protein
MIVVYHRGKQYSYFEIEVDQNVSMKFGTLCPHFPPKKWKELVTDKDMELNFHSWSLKASGEHVYFITKHSELKVRRELCMKAFEKASGDGLYFASDIPYLA